MLRAQSLARKNASMWSYIVIAGTLVSLGLLSSASPVNQFSDVSPAIPIVVPNTKNIDSAALKAIGADKFLSLWFINVLLDNVRVSDQPSTFFIPLNSGLPKDSSILSDKELITEVLLNHVVIGKSIDLKAADSMGNVFYSIAQSELAVTKEGDDIKVNGVRLTGDELNFDNVRIYIVEETLPFLEPEFLEVFSEIPTENISLPVEKISINPSDVNLLVTQDKEHVEKKKDSEIDFEIFTTTEKQPEKLVASQMTSRPTRFDKFRRQMENKLSKLQLKPTTEAPHSSVIKTTTETMSSSSEAQEIFDSNLQTSASHINIETKLDPDVEFFGEFLVEEPLYEVSNTFLYSLIQELNTSNSRASEFVNHFTKNNLGQYLSPDTNYTVIVPTNGAFYDYYPIDWGFNPFLVENFTKDVLLNHFMEGDIPLQEFNDSVEIQTIAGRILMVTKDIDGKLVVNGNIIPAEMEVELPSGRIYYVNEMLFVDYSRVNRLREKNPWFETAPLLSFPWPSSPFLSHLLQRLQENNSTKLFAHLLRNSDISSLVSSSDEHLNRLTYTGFIPTDEALQKAFKAENMAVLDKKSINNFLLEHLVSGYLFLKDFENGFSLLTLTEKVVPIRIKNDTIFLKDAKIIEPQQFIYNLGTIFIVDKPLKEIELGLSTNRPVTQEQPDIIEDVEIVPLQEGILNNQISNPEYQEGDNTEATDVPVTEAGVIYEVRTEISFARQINNGIIEPVSRDVIEKAKRRNNKI